MPTGADTIVEVKPVQTDWRGDPLEGEEPEEREIPGCELIPRVSPDDETLIIDGWQIFVPPSQQPPDPRSVIRARSAGYGSEVVDWEIDGNIGIYGKAGAPKGALFLVKRVL